MLALMLSDLSTFTFSNLWENQDKSMLSLFPNGGDDPCLADLKWLGQGLPLCGRIGIWMQASGPRALVSSLQYFASYCSNLSYSNFIINTPFALPHHLGQCLGWFSPFIQQIFIDYLLCTRLPSMDLCNKNLLSPCWKNTAHCISTQVICTEGKSGLQGVMWFLLSKTPSLFLP